MDKQEINKLLNHVYYEQKNYDSINELYRKAKVFNKNLKKEDVKTWLKAQSTHQQTTSKKIKKRDYLPIYSDSYYAFQIDLTFMPAYKSTNKNYYVIFTAINVNSRYAYAYYAKDKSEESIIKMLDDWLKNALIIESVTMDEGSEFTNKKVKEWFKQNDISTFYIFDDSHKLGIINRFHRTLKDKMLKYFIANDNTTWYNVIDIIIKNYNNTRNTGIYNFTPKEASKHYIQNYIINKAIEKTKTIDKTYDDDIDESFHVGDTVRIRIKSDIFDKMKKKYSELTYTITNVYKNSCDIVNDKYKINKAKKVDLIKVNDVQNFVPNNNKKQVEKEHRVENRLKKIDVQTENIIVNEKRIRKPNSKYQ